MRKTSILIPLILIACLAALGYLIYRAIEDAKVEPGDGNNEIVLNPDDYRQNTDPETGNRPDFNLDNDRQQTDANTPPPAGSLGTPTDRDIDDYFPETDDEPIRPTGETASPSPATPPSAQSTTTRPPRITGSGGRYLVLAGTFRQRANAESRVASLKAAGFSDTRVANFDRGTYAVALAGRSNSYGQATDMADRIRRAGFEAVVMEN